MKLEDIKLQLGDKITFDDGYIAFISQNDNKVIKTWKHKDRIAKIERYVCHSGMCQYEDDNEVTTLTHGINIFYTLETIWERKEILDKEEKEYLSNVIRPFRDRVIRIRKSEFSTLFETIEYDVFPDFDKVEYNMYQLPMFPKNTMYKGMELNKEYSLEELGL